MTQIQKQEISLQMTQILTNDVGTLNKITEKIIGLAIEVHNRLRPGFTEKIYQEALSLDF